MVTPAHDLCCGSKLTVQPASARPRSWTCALEPHDFNVRHRAADGTEWRATDFPPTAPPPPRGEPACGQRYTSRVDPQQSYVCSRPEGHYAEPHYDHEAGVSWSRAGDLRPTSLAVGMTSVGALTALANERGGLIAKYRAAIACEGECTCGPVTDESGDREEDPLCPQDGTVAQMARQLRWANSFTRRIEDVLPPEILEPFAMFDVAGEVVRRIQLAEQIEAVRVALREAGLGFASPANDVRDLVEQRDGAQEHAKNAEDALARIAELARRACATTEGGTAADEALAAIIAECERSDR